VTSDLRVRTAAALVGLAAVGTSAAGWVDATPAPLRVGLVLFGGVVAPAFLCVPIVRRWIGGPRAAVAAGALFFVLSLHAVVSESFRLAGAAFSVYATSVTWMLVLALLAAVVRSWAFRIRPVASWRPRAGDGVFLLALAALVAVAAAARYPFTVWEDAFDHIGFVRRVVTFDSMRPDHLLAWPADATASLAPDPRKGALHPAVAWIGQLAGVDPEVVWSLLPLVFFPGFVLAFTAFSQALLRARPLLLLCVALFMLSYAGTAFQLAHAAPYGQNLAAAWYWLLAAVVLSPGRGIRPHRRLVAVAILAFGGALAHVGVLLHAAVLAASLALFARAVGLGYRSGLAYAATIAVAAGVAALLRWDALGAPSNVIHTHVQGVLFVGEHGAFVMSPMEILRQHGMAYLGGIVLVPVLAFVARHRSDARAVVALCVLPVAIAFVPPFATALYAQGSYMVFRSLLNAPVFAGGAIVLAWAIDSARQRGVVVRALAATLIAAWTLAFVRPSLDATLADASQRAPAAAGVDAELTEYVASLPGGTTILTDPPTAYALSARTSHRFVAILDQHANPHDPYAIDRLGAIRDALSPYVVPDRCVDAFRRYGVDVVIVNANAERGAFVSVWDAVLYRPTLARMHAIPSLREMHSAVSFAAFVFDPVATPPDYPDPPAAPVVVEPRPIDPCVVTVPGRSFEVIGAAAHPSQTAPGDSTTIALGYRRDEATPFDLPLLLHLRFDHESVAAGVPYPGEKYVRRFGERRRGVVTRFRVDLKPGAGVFDPDLWPLGAELCERVTVVVPPHAVPGSYQVEVGVVRDSLLPNFDLRDLLYNRDHYSGTPCTTLVVGKRP
jgi:hypothetical protein